MPDRFLTGEKAAHIKIDLDRAKDQLEGGDFATYTFGRYEGCYSDSENTTELHGIAFIEEVIPELITEAITPGRPLPILCMADGAAIFSEQIRREFPGLVDVYSTGLSSKTALNYRSNLSSVSIDPVNFHTGQWTPSQALHPQDFIARSVLELPLNPRFALIVDTVGESTYGCTTLERTQEILTAVSKLLLPGGRAYLTLMARVRTLRLDLDWFYYGIEALENESPDIHVNFDRMVNLYRMCIKKAQKA